MVKAWDLPLRLFKWTFVLLIIAAPLTKWYGASNLTWHKINGYCLLILLIWRLLWGFYGSKTALFSTFFPTPTKVFTALKGKAGVTLSHTPLGTLMIFALLGLTLLQTLTGLFATDDISVDGPFLHLMPKIGDFASKYHHLIFKAIWILAIIHILANLIYTFVLKQPLISAMVTGKRPKETFVDVNENNEVSTIKAIALLAFSASLVFGSLLLFGKGVF
jgi:cytochrome b